MDNGLLKYILKEKQVHLKSAQGGWVSNGFCDGDCGSNSSIYNNDGGKKGGSGIVIIRNASS